MDLATLCVALLAAVPLVAFVGYPAFCFLLSRTRPPLAKPAPPTAWPSITLIVSAFNEGRVIREKIENALALDYPRDRLQILVPTDGSTDGTDSIVQEFQSKGVVLLRSERNRGKTAALKEATRLATGSVIVYSDANSLYDPLALRHLARWMKDRRVGCVCGRLIYADSGNSAADSGEKRYWSWDTRIKQWEGRSGYLLGANGAIFALRKFLAVSLPSDQSNDMVLPIAARLRGYFAVFDPEAVATESTAGTVKREMRRKTRIIARGINGVVFSLHFAFRDTWALSTPLPSRLFVLFQVVAKKLFRYLSFPSLAGLMALGPVAGVGWAARLSGLLWMGLAATVLLTVAGPLTGLLFRRRPNFAYPLTVAFAACAGFALFLTGRDVSRWKSQR